MKGSIHAYKLTSQVYSLSDTNNIYVIKHSTPPRCNEHENESDFLSYIIGKW